MTNLTDLASTRWTGKGELWLDPLGNQADECDVTLAVLPGALEYRWSYAGAPHTGRLALGPDALKLVDTFHSPKPMRCPRVQGTWALAEGFGTYAAGEGPPWGWRVSVSLRPSGELLLQMTNVAPWGEEVRAVRMILRRAP